ncbi:MAG: TVP38/TMEM64 family protein [Planctomycetota bacterium]|nr:MAG: TVP38/TMEM64 family protein [Planctomycetota bacterium]
MLEKNKIWITRTITFTIIALIVLVIYANDWHQLLTIEELRVHRDELKLYAENNFLLALSVFVMTYIVVTALSIPGATIMTLAGGAIFGRGVGFVSILISAAIGATLAMIVSRYLLGTWVQSKFSKKLQTVNEGIEKNGAYYLFAMQLVPVIPFFIINLTMGLTKLSPWKFFTISLFGLAPGCFIFVNAGAELGTVNNFDDIISLRLILSLVLLGIMPLLLKFLLNYFKPNKN